MADIRGDEVHWQELTKSECFELLAHEHLGRVAVVDDRGPVVVPVTFVLDRHMVVFRTDEGTKLDAASRGSRVAFEIDGIDAVAHTGWSVLVRGEAVEVIDPAELARVVHDLAPFPEPGGQPVLLSLAQRARSQSQVIPARTTAR